jgi:5-methylcytosine-specific restriction endonuclease McrA
MLRQAKQILERELGERLTDNALLRTFARMVIDGAATPERASAPYQMATLTCDQCKRAWQVGAGLTVEMSPAARDVALCDAQHIGRVDEPSAESSPQPAPGRAQTKRAGSGRRAKSDIPPALRRAIRARDQGKCRVPWCRSARNVDQHHITPVSEGGAHTLENIISLCESHHIAHHAGALIISGTALNATFTRRAHNSFAIAERAVETARALKHLGFDKREVSAAMDRTRTHVGTTELTLEQWIKIALSYCPKPKS